MEELTSIVESQEFTLITAIIDKANYAERYSKQDNPYHLALGFGLERTFYYLRSLGQAEKPTHILVEARGKREDDELELEFRRICDGGNYQSAQLPFDIVFVDKKSNSAGLQLADLVARPVGVHYLRPDQCNRAFDVLEGKFYANGRGRYQGWGLKCFP